MNPIRAQAVSACAPYGLKVMIDRLDGLFAVDVSRRPEYVPAVTDALESLHLRCAARGKMLIVTPDLSWREPFEKWITARIEPGALSADFSRFTEKGATGHELACWIRGLKRLSLNDEGDYERDVRQTAAVALREDGGGLLRACALTLDGIRQEA